MTVLILADDLDLSVDAMITELTRRRVPATRLNMEWFPRQLSLDAELQDGRWVGELSTETRRVRLEEVQAVWRRNPTAFGLAAALTDAERQHAHTEAKLGVGGVLMSLPVMWVNRPDLAARASYKPLQLQIAAAAGLAVLPTLVTNVAASVHRFAAEHGDVVTKMLGAPTITEAGGRRVAFTDRLTPGLLSDLAGISQTAHQFQRWAPKLCECRVVAVGDALFAVLIHAGSTKAWVDWRSDYPSLSYEVIEPPPEVAVGVKQVMHVFGLAYGAFDFVIGPDHTWYFLEVNPGGQYGFLEERAGIGVTAALADLLIGARP